jgi:hypothetical protein
MRAQLVLALLLGSSGVASAFALHQEPGDLPSGPQPTSVYQAAIAVEPIHPKYSRQSLASGNLVYKWQANNSEKLVGPQALSMDVFKWKAAIVHSAGLFTQKGHLVEGVSHWQNQGENSPVTFNSFKSASFGRTELPGQAPALSHAGPSRGRKAEVSVDLKTMRQMYRQLYPAIHRTSH